jgi:Esterase-like activity of phytase/Dockerin type I domain
MMQLLTRAAGVLLLELALTLAVGMPRVADAGWTVTARSSVTLAAGPVSNIRELSGVTYLGPQAGGLERFAAIQDENRRIVIFDVSFAANGAINSAAAVSTVTITGGSDFEGIAYTGAARNSVFVSEENTPTIREFRLSDAAALQAIALPEVYEHNRDNRGLESLTRSVDGLTMWTANEEALTIDGPASSQAAGTLVRLQQMTDVGTSVEFGPQFVYQVDPIHAGSSPDRSGLSDLVMLPDDTLLALERSRTGTGLTTSFRNRIYQVDFTGATDVSGPAFDGGLVGTSYTETSKNLLWSSQSFGINNLEGIGLGPVLPNGNWVLLGVVDDGGLGFNLISSYELSRSGCLLAGDYNCSGTVDDSDYTLWKNTFGSTEALAADGNADGVVNAADYTLWRNNLGASPGQAGLAVPEPTGWAFLLLAGILWPAAWRWRRPSWAPGAG